MLENLNHTIDIWLKAMAEYDLTELCVKPSPKSWSLGQLYIHLIEDTNFYLDQIKICVSTNDHADKEASPAAKKIFLNNDFPDEFIEGAPTNDLIPQPENKEALSRALMNLKDEHTRIAPLIYNSPFKGKTKHPGFNYFNAVEWLQFAEIHFRHHLRQKRRIESYLKLTRGAGF